MARFPLREAAVMTLAQNMATGLAGNGAVYPMPPVTAAVLQAELDDLIAQCDAVVAARAAAELATANKAATLAKLTDSMKFVLRYAEEAVDYDDAQLSLLGWGAKAAPKALTAPGQVGTLAILEQGEGWVKLAWNKPADGGTVASYKVERRERPSGTWTLIALAMETGTTLTQQERGKDWEYRIIAANKAGEGMASNTVGAVV